MRKIIACAVLLGLSTSSAAQVLADDGSGTSPGLEEIRVTARKREENLQKTPVSVVAFTSRDLEEGNVKRIDDIERLTPNVQFNPLATHANTAYVGIRGIATSDPLPTRDPGVGVYLDGTYLARAQGALLGLVDVERVEVLRGPQGTLFGRNTVGGAIQVITKKPSEEFAASTTLGAGNYGLFESRASLNLPLLPEKAAVRLSFGSTNRDGYGKNSLLGNETDDRQSVGGHVALRWNPTDAIELLLSGEQTRTHTAGRAGECRFAPEKLATAPLMGAMERAGLGFMENCRESQADDRFSYRSPIRSSDDLDTWGAASALRWDLKTMSLQSLSSWRRQKGERNQDFSFAATEFGHLIDHPNQQDELSQELTLTGKALAGRLTWTSGTFFLYETTEPALAETRIAFELCKSPATICGPSFVQRSSISTHALAGYGQITYDLSDRLHFTAGLRRSLERKEYSQAQQNFATPTTLRKPFATSQSARFNAWTPLLNASLDLSEHAMVYATYSRGFKSGGFNGRPAPDVKATLEPFEEELLDNYEIGLRSTWFENRLSGNVSLFWGKYHDIQRTVLAQNGTTGALASRVANAAQAIIQGAEVDVRAVPIDGLDLRLALGFTDARSTKLSDFGGPTGNAPVKLKFPWPSFTASVSAAYTARDLLRVGDLSLRVSWYHSEEVNYGVADTLLQNRYGLLSARLALALRNHKTEIALFGENLLDRRYFDTATSLENAFAYGIAYYGQPRMYGIEIRQSL